MLPLREEPLPDIMSDSPHSRFQDALSTYVRGDHRIVGLLDYGSGSEGRMDEWSDFDLALFIKDDAFEVFLARWKVWVAEFGKVLLAYRGRVGKPWVIYDTQPLPLRVDYDFYRVSEIKVIRSWPVAPLHIDAMVWYDALDGALTAEASRLIGQPQGPPGGPQATFERVSGDFWYYFLRTLSRYNRDHLWAARFDLNHIIYGNLMALLRLEAGAFDHWRTQTAATNIEAVLSPDRQAQLDTSIPGIGKAGLQESLIAVSRLGYEVCESISASYKWPWPVALADRVIGLVA